MLPKKEEVSSVFRIDFGKLKIGYDVFSCAISIVLSLVFFSGIQGIGIGSILCAFVNGPTIDMFSRLLERKINFSPALPQRFVSLFQISSLNREGNEYD